MAAKHRLKIEQGSTFARTFRLKDSVGNYIDLTGYSARMQVRQSHSATTAIVDIDSGSKGGVEVEPDSTQGAIKITLTATETAQLTAPLAGVWDLEIVSGGGEVTRVLEGAVRITPEVTR